MRLTTRSALDYVVAIALILAPFIFGFINNAPNAWLPHIVVGIAVIVVVIFSKPRQSAPVSH